MAVEIRKLIPDLAEDYVHFFDTTPHDDNVDEHKCYCVCWCYPSYQKALAKPVKVSFASAF